MNIEKARKYLPIYENSPKYFEQDYFNIAICEVVLGNYSRAYEYFNASIPFLFGSNPYWRASSLVTWLVDITTMSGRYDLYPEITTKLVEYRMSATRYHPGGNSPLAHYCFGVMELINPTSGNAIEWIDLLQKCKKLKDMQAIGFVLSALLNLDQALFTNSMGDLLKAHEGKAKYGELRLSPEGWLCLPAMTLSFVAFRRNMKFEFDNEYFSQGYLNYLISRM